MGIIKRIETVFIDTHRLLELEGSGEILSLFSELRRIIFFLAEPSISANSYFKFFLESLSINEIKSREKQNHTGQRGGYKVGKWWGQSA